MERIRILKAALKHGIIEGEIREALADKFRRNFEVHEDEYVNPQDMAVGHTQRGVLLEIGICYKALTDNYLSRKQSNSPLQATLQQGQMKWQS